MEYTLSFFIYFFWRKKSEKINGSIYTFLLLFLLSAPPNDGAFYAFFLENIYIS